MTDSTGKHTSWCTMWAIGHSDAAKRVSDTYNLHRIGRGPNAIGKWFAVSLSEGRSDDVLYDSKRDCVRHQHHMEQFYAFIRIAPCDMKACEAEVMLRTQRQLYDKGLRMADPDHRAGGYDRIRRLTVEDELAAMRGRVTNLIMPWEATE